jgi:50S ribosomal protein L16 3-hydroxylase
MTPEFPALRFPPGVDETRFLAEYWQQRPLLMQQAFPGLASPLSADELAGLACEPGIESRLVREQGPDRPWQVDHGPLEEAIFARLPEHHWTLLVQDVDKYVPEVAALLARFRFIPEWRLDDIMISYATDGGSVGPHVDAYDVFLIQVEGSRRWRIDTRPEPPDDCVPDLELRILRRFESDRDWLLQPGDVLYLPPGVPHWGIAEGECVTWSVGLRAPSWQELALDWAEHLADGGSTNAYRDPALTPPEDPAEITAEAFRHFRDGIERTLRGADDHAFRAWLGALLTEPKPHLAPEPPETPLSAADAVALLRREGRLLRQGASRLLYCMSPASGGEHLLFANGIAHRITGERRTFLTLLCRRPGILAAELDPWLDEPDCAALFCALVNDGHFALD